MNIVFRTDASIDIGSGHVMRCLTLAYVLHAKGANIHFICREHKGHLCQLIDESGFTVTRLLAPVQYTPIDNNNLHASWLGTSWHDDLDETLAILNTLEYKTDWLILDHYAIDSRWEKGVRSQVKRIMVIDDLADRSHDCDLLLDQNLNEDMDLRYQGLVSTKITMLLGPEYALLQPVYMMLHKKVHIRKNPVKRIFIFLGGADKNNVTELALCAFLKLNRPDIDVDIVLSANKSSSEAVRKLSDNLCNIHIHNNLPTLAQLMFQADLSIGAGGSTTWERLCLGLPTLVITLADNQHSVTKNLHNLGLVNWIGHSDTIDENTIKKQLESVLALEDLADWSARCLDVCSGKGASDVASRLLKFEED